MSGLPTATPDSRLPNAVARSPLPDTVPRPVLQLASLSVGLVSSVRQPAAPVTMARPDRDAYSLHLAKVVDASDDAIVSKNLDGIILSWNPAAARIFGYDADEVVGRSIRVLIPDHLQAEEDQVLATLRAGGKVDHYETTRRRKDGSLIDVSLSVSPLRDDSGQIIGATKIARDITEQVRLRRENLALYEQARHANHVKDEFLAVLSHELRTPLNAIVGYTALLRSGAFDARGAEHALQTVERNAKVLTRMVDDVLDVSRIVTGKLQLDVQLVDVSVSVENAVATVRPAADAKGVSIGTAIAPTVGPVSGDPSRLQQVAWNLLSNAVKFTPAGGHVQVDVRRVDAQVELRVRDTGAGIALELLPHVFERFWQADSSPTRAVGGLGLGLAIVRHIVEMHGGTVEANSAGPGRGATFTVRLPLISSHVD